MTRTIPTRYGRRGRLTPFLIGALFLTSCFSASPIPNAGDGGSGGAGGTSGCVETALCTRTSHWDPTACACVPNAGDGGSGGAGGTSGCVETALCTRTSHWDSTACACVPNDSGGSGGAACVDNVLCIQGSHWDSVQCKCVPSAAGSCSSSSDCRGLLPQLCQVCADGSTACAHHECIAGKCEVVTCPIASGAQSCGPNPVEASCPSGTVCTDLGGSNGGRCVQDPDGQACGPDAVPQQCPPGYACDFTGGVDTGHCRAY